MDILFHCSSRSYWETSLTTKGYIIIHVHVCVHVLYHNDHNDHYCNYLINYVSLSNFDQIIFISQYCFIEEGSGSWEDGMSPESSAMLFRALNSLIERLVSVTER